MGLSQLNGKIYMVIRDKVEVFDISGKKLHTLATEGNKYISTSENNIFCSKYSNDNVCCFDMNGQEVWKFHNDSLQYPYGVANDRSGNVFVVGCKFRNLIIIQYDGKTYKNLLDLEKGSSPHAICYNEDKNTLLISDDKECESMKGDWPELEEAVGSNDGTSHKINHPCENQFNSGYSQIHFIHTQVIIDTEK
ncbi:unnamed protein product [Mytilus coruscus]|uniref:Uncharacterized protein n=1 Tax=Mytilus coruscus TaxID=42192 RepID=A0A6J8A2M8_MYTCO|nr:unnamed protein product [Mytilus coruscus]